MATSVPVSFPATQPVPAVMPVMPPHEEASIAFAKIEPELATLSVDELIRPTLDIRRAVLIAIGAAAKLQPFRDQIAEELPQFPIAKIDGLKDYALAAFFAHVNAEPSSAAESAIGPMLEEASPLRDRLLAVADMLADLGIFPAARVADIRGGTGHLDAAADLIALSTMFREKWVNLGDRTPLSRAEIDRAHQVGTAIVLALGPRSHAGGETPVTVESADRRLRAFTLFVHAYDVARRAISFVRWDEGDAESFVPSLFLSRARPKRSTKSEGDVPTVPVEPVAPAPGGVMPVSDG